MKNIETIHQLRTSSLLTTIEKQNRIVVKVVVIVCPKFVFVLLMIVMVGMNVSSDRGECQKQFPHYNGTTGGLMIGNMVSSSYSNRFSYDTES